jgi:hypothetical protein
VSDYYGNGAQLKPLTLIDAVAECQTNWPMGTVVQEVHTGTCCPEEPMCDFYAPLWEMAFQCGWTRAGKSFDPNDDEPRIPLRLLWHPDWSLVLPEGLQQ